MKVSGGWFGTLTGMSAPFLEGGQYSLLRFENFLLIVESIRRSDRVLLSVVGMFFTMVVAFFLFGALGTYSSTCCVTITGGGT